jgi:hypothetical protein
MHTSIKSSIILGFIFASILQARSEGYIVPNGISFDDHAGAFTTVTIVRNPVNADSSHLSLRPGFKVFPGIYYTLFSLFGFVDDSVRSFLVSANDPISLPAIQANSYTELTSGNYYFFDVNVPFYLGFYAGDTNGTPGYRGTYSNPAFGWGEFVNNNGVIEMLDSALEMEGGGIYAGTQQIIPVPEPAAFGLFGLGALLIGRSIPPFSTSVRRRVLDGKASPRISQ